MCSPRKQRNTAQGFENRSGGLDYGRRGSSGLRMWSISGWGLVRGGLAAAGSIRAEPVKTPYQISHEFEIKLQTNSG
jgi:hypothetical protein